MRDLSALLADVDLQGRSWCYSQIGECTCVSIPPVPALVFHAVIHGSIRLVCGQETVELAAGDAVFVLPGAAHALRPPRSAAAVVHEFLRAERQADAPQTLTFSESQGPTWARLLTGLLRAHWPPEVDLMALPKLIKVNRGGPAATIFTPTALASAAAGSGSAALLTRMASLLLIGELRSHPQFTRRLVPSGDDPLARAMNLIRSNPSHGWTVDRLARAVGMGRSCFAEQFTRKFGRAPMETVTCERMERAAALVRDGKLKITDISEIVGYGSEAAFSRRFAAHFGMSAKAMRDRAKESTDDLASAIPRRFLSSVGPAAPQRCVEESSSATEARRSAARRTRTILLQAKVS